MSAMRMVRLRIRIEDVVVLYLLVDFLGVVPWPGGYDDGGDEEVGSLVGSARGPEESVYSAHVYGEAASVNVA